MRNMLPFEQKMYDDMMADIADGTFVDRAFSQREHAQSKHVACKPSELIDQMFQEGKTAASSFLSRRDMMACIDETFVAVADRVCELREDARKTGKCFDVQFLMDHDVYQDPSDSVDFRTRHKGIRQFANGDIREVYSDKTKAVCKVEPLTRYGFEIVTAYPDLKDASAIGETGRDLTEDLHASRTYKQAARYNRVFRAYLDEAIRFDRPFDIQMERTGFAYRDEMTVKVPSKDRDTEHRVFVGERSCTVKTYQRDPQTGRFQRVPTRIGDRYVPQANLLDPKTRDAFFADKPEALAYIEHVEASINGEEEQPQRQHGPHAKELSPKLRELRDKWAREDEMRAAGNEFDY